MAALAAGCAADGTLSRPHPVTALSSKRAPGRGSNWRTGTRDAALHLPLSSAIIHPGRFPDGSLCALLGSNHRAMAGTAGATISIGSPASTLLALAPLAHITLVGAACALLAAVYALAAGDCRLYARLVDAATTLAACHQWGPGRCGCWSLLLFALARYVACQIWNLERKIILQ